MVDPVLLAAFLLASVVVIVTPGPDLVFVAVQSIGRGRRAGMVAAPGTCSGLLVHAGNQAQGLGMRSRRSGRRPRATGASLRRCSVRLAGGLR